MASFQALPVLTFAMLQPEMKVTSAENSRQLDKRFAFLWSSAHRVVTTNAALASHMIASMMQLARTSRAQLPQSVLDFICENCGGLLVPTVSAGVRVVSQSRKSPANRRLARQQRRAQQQNGSNGPRRVRESLSTIVRVTCHRCKHNNDRPGTSVVHKSKTKKREREEEQDMEPAKRLKRENGESVTCEESVAVVSSGSTAAATSLAAPVQLEMAPTSLFAPPPSPPRKLLDGPKRKKKKKTKVQPDAAVVAVKSSLSSFLQKLGSRK